ncbi:hypothetical protein KPH14_006121 [Odynerus spinipes]|uniref:Maternal protein exuperantia n=1 Tax=Odynerus spinipes TaxID=1348599 RepID=A0AAD9RJU9_9HYME|nr:hypothetical protein KPH14_006121 [Odynerus spinipes]
MVASTIAENGTPTEEQPSSTAGILPGDYRLVGWDMDTTGKRLMDEICQIAGYTPSSTYSQYVMPYKDLNPPAIKRHNMRVVTIGKYRMLKNNKTNKVLKTKSEVSALIDFLTWLESVKGDATDGIILLYHEPPQAKCTNSVHTFSLRTLSRTLLKRTEELDNAKDRACLALQVLQHISLKENTKAGETSGSGDSDAAMKGTIEFIRPFIQPIHVEEEERAKLKVIFERQNSLRPIFGPLFKVSRKERQHLSPLRRLLAEAGIEYSHLQEAWSNGKKEGLEQLIKEKLTAAENKEIEDLIKVLENYFDPEKNPKAKSRHEKKEIKPDIPNIIDDKENNNKCDSGTETPDTSSSSPLKIKSEPSENGEVSVEG